MQSDIGPGEETDQSKLSRAVHESNDILRGIDPQLPKLEVVPITNRIVSLLDELVRGTHFGKRATVVGEHWLPAIASNTDNTDVPVDYIKGFSRGRSNGYIVTDVFEDFPPDIYSNDESRVNGDRLKERLQQYGRYSLSYLLHVATAQKSVNSSSRCTTDVYSIVAPIRMNNIYVDQDWHSSDKRVTIDTTLNLLLNKLRHGQTDHLMSIQSAMDSQDESIFGLIKAHPSCKEILNTGDESINFLLTEYLQACTIEQFENRLFTMSTLPAFKISDETGTEQLRLNFADGNARIKIFGITYGSLGDEYQQRPGGNASGYGVELKAFYYGDDCRLTIDIPLEYFDPDSIINIQIKK